MSEYVARISERIDEIHGRVDRVEDELFRADPERPGLAVRMDRIERTMKYAAVIVLAGGGCAVAFQLLQYLTALAVKAATP